MPLEHPLCQRKAEGRLDNRLAKLGSRRKITKKAHAVGGQEIKWEISTASAVDKATCQNETKTPHYRGCKRPGLRRASIGPGTKRSVLHGRLCRVVRLRPRCPRLCQKAPAMVPLHRIAWRTLGNFHHLARSCARQDPYQNPNPAAASRNTNLDSVEFDGRRK